MSTGLQPVEEAIDHTGGDVGKRQFGVAAEPPEPVGGSPVKVGGSMFARLAFAFHQRVGVGEEGCCCHK